MLNRWKENVDNSFENSQLTASQNTRTRKSANEKSPSNNSYITQNTFTTTQQIVYPTTQSIQQVNCTIDSVGVNVSTDSNFIVANTSEPIPHVDKPDNDRNNRSDFDATGNHSRYNTLQIVLIILFIFVKDNNNLNILIYQ